MIKEINRIQWIDYLKGICMIAIVMNHLSWPEWYARFLSPFHLVGFFFVAGYTFNLKASFREFLVTKIRTLLIPVLVFGLLNALLTYIYPGTILKDRLIGILTQIPGKWDDLWFVACLFTMSILFYPIVKYVKSNVLRFVVTVVAAIAGIYTFNQGPDLPWQFENACILLPAIYIGYWARSTNAGKKVMHLLRNSWTLLALLVMYVLLICVYDNYPIDVHILNYGSFPFFWISAIIGTMLIISISMNLESIADRFSLRALQYVGKNTLIYYACQSKVITILIAVLSIANIYTTNYISNILVALAVCVFLVIPTEIINKFCPFILGRKRYYNKS